MTSLLVAKFTEQYKYHVELSLQVVLLSTRNVQSWVTDINTSGRTRNAGVKLEVLAQAGFPPKPRVETGVSHSSRELAMSVTTERRLPNALHLRCMLFSFIKLSNRAAGFPCASDIVVTNL